MTIIASEKMEGVDNNTNAVYEITSCVETLCNNMFSVMFSLLLFYFEFGFVSVKSVYTLPKDAVFYCLDRSLIPSKF